MVKRQHGILALALSLVIIVALLSGCSPSNNTAQTSSQSASSQAAAPEDSSAPVSIPDEPVSASDDSSEEVSGVETGALLSTTMTYDGIERMYQYYLPTSYTADGNLPLMINLHGMGSNSAGQVDTAKMDQLAEQEGFVLLAPNSVYIDEEGNITCEGKSWYDDQTLTRENIAWNAGYAANEQLSAVDDVGYISALIDYFVDTYGVNPDRVYATGMSNGGIFCERLAIELADKLAGVGSVTGPLARSLEGATPVEPIKFVLVMSDADPVVSYEGSTVLLSSDETVAFWLEHYGIEGDPEVTELPQTNEEDATKIVRYAYPKGDGEFVFYLVEGGGHGWPGGHQYLPVEMVGVVSSQASASEFLWNELKDISK